MGEQGLFIRGELRTLKRGTVHPKNGSEPFPRVIAVIDTGDDYLPQVFGNLTERGSGKAMESALTSLVGQEVTIRVAKVYGELHFAEVVG